MNKEELLELKNEFIKLQDKRNEMINLMIKIEEQKEKPEVKKYLELIELFQEKTNKLNNFYKKTDDELLSLVLSKTKITPSKEIYVYIGTYKYSNEIDIIHSTSDIKVSRYDTNADYVVYYNLEDRYDTRIEIPYSKMKEFESLNNIIFPQNVLSKERYFYELQFEYFKTLILNSEEEANEMINKLIKRK